jgi:peptidyl-prolyl cis-trans isomerase C
MRHSRGPAASAPLRATLALLLGVAFTQPGLAQPAPAAPPADPIVARVDGEEIRFSDLTNAAQELPEELRGAPPQMLSWGALRQTCQPMLKPKTKNPKT